MTTTFRCPSTPALRISFPLGLLALGVAAAITTICLLPAQAWAADDTSVQRLATCKDSWNDWSEGDPRLKQYVTFIESKLTQADGAAFTPKMSMTAFGLPVTQVFPQSVGMGVGFSVLVTGEFTQVRKLFEAQLGRPLTCGTSEGSPSCQLELGAKKTIVLLGDGPRGNKALVGCYYFYQQ